MIGKGKDICVKVFEKNMKGELEHVVNEWLQAEGKELSIQDIKYSNLGMPGGGSYSVLVIISPD